MQPPPPVPPPSGHGQYYRPSAYQGSADRLQALADGYFGLNWAFLGNILVVFAVWITVAIFLGAANPKLQPTRPPVFFAFGFLPYILIGAVVVAITYRPNSRIAYGMGWKPSGAIVASLLMGLNSALCCGLIGYVVMQQIAYGEMKKYGVRVGFFSASKRKIMEAVEDLRRSQYPPPQQPNIPPTEGQG